MNLKIATLNLCLGLNSKKEKIKELILKNNVEILCLQEVEFEHDYDNTLLNFMGYNLETETNTQKRRTTIYNKNHNAISLHL